MTIMVDFKHRRHAAASPPMRLVAAYGTQQRNGKSKALKTIIRHSMQSRGCLAAGDLNVTPDASWRCSRRRATAADDEFEAITGGGEAGDGTSMVGIVDLGLNHAQGQFSRAHWTDRLADGSPKGTATLDHVLVSGLERGSWTRRAVWHAFGDGGRLVSDHMLIIVERAPRCAPPDDSGVHRLPRYLVSKWKPHQVAAYTASFELGLTQLRAGQWRSGPDGERQTLGRGADAIVQLVALLNAASAAAVIATRGDPLRDRLRRVRDAGGGLQGIKAQLRRQQCILQTVRRARLGLVQAASALASLRPDALAHRRLRAEVQGHQCREPWQHCCLVALNFRRDSSIEKHQMQRVFT
jgi:hypothetical protein